MRNRLWTIVSVMLMVGAIAAGWFLAIDPALKAAADADSQRETVETQNEATRAVIQKLSDDKQKLPELTTELASLQEAIPVTTATPAFIDDLNAIASAAGVVVSNITIASAEAYAAPVDETAAVVPAADSAAADGTAPTPAPVEEVDPANPATVTNGAISGDNFVLIPVTIEVKGSYAQALDFVDGLQKGKRMFLVTGFTSIANSEEDAGAGSVTATTTGYIYVLKNQYDLTAATK